MLKVHAMTTYNREFYEIITVKWRVIYAIIQSIFIYCSLGLHFIIFWFKPDRYIYKYFISSSENNKYNY